MQTQNDQFHTLRLALEEQYQQHTDELTGLTVHSVDPERGGYDRETISARIAATRQKLADTTRALVRMSEGSYGYCERCQASIPVERLEIRPYARYCVPCQLSVTH